MPFVKTCLSAGHLSLQLANLKAAASTKDYIMKFPRGPPWKRALSARRKVGVLQSYHRDLIDDGEMSSTCTFIWQRELLPPGHR